MLRIEVIDDFTTPAVFIVAHQLFAGFGCPEYFAFFAFVVEAVVFCAVVAEGGFQCGMDGIFGRFFGDDVDDTALCI